MSDEYTRREVNAAAGTALFLDSLFGTSSDGADSKDGSPRLDLPRLADFGVAENGEEVDVDPKWLDFVGDQISVEATKKGVEIQFDGVSGTESPWRENTNDELEPADDQPVTVPKLNNANLATASSGTVPTARGDGTLTMQDVGSDYEWTLLHEHTERINDGESAVFSDEIGDYDEYRISYNTALGGSSVQMRLRFNENNSNIYNYLTIGVNGVESFHDMSQILLTEGRSNADTAGTYTISAGPRMPTIRGSSASRFQSDTSERFLFSGFMDEETPLNSFEVVAEGGDLAFDAGDEYKLEIYGRGGTGN